MHTAYLPTSPFTPNVRPPVAARYYTLEEIGQRVRKERKRRGENQASAAGHFGCTQSAVSQAERAEPGMESLLRAMAKHYLGWDYSEAEYRRVE